MVEGFAPFSKTVKTDPVLPVHEIHCNADTVLSLMKAQNAQKRFYMAKNIL